MGGLPLLDGELHLGLGLTPPAAVPDNAAPAVPPPAAPPAAGPPPALHDNLFQKIQADKRLKLGPGTICTVRAKQIGPQNVIKTAFPNDLKTRMLGGLVVDSFEIGNGGAAVLIKFRPTKLRDQENALEEAGLSCNVRNLTVTTPCHHSLLFWPPTPAALQVAPAAPAAGAETPNEHAPDHEGLHPLQIDDDNAPLPENIPAVAGGPSPVTWDDVEATDTIGIDLRARAGIPLTKCQPSLRDVANPATLTEYDIFWMVSVVHCTPPPRSPAGTLLRWMHN